MNKKRKRIQVWFGILMTACVIAGCGNADNGSGDKEPETAQQKETAQQTDKETAAEARETTQAPAAEGEDSAQYAYIEQVMVEDSFGDKAEHAVFAPVGSTSENGFLSYYDHGLSFSAMVYTSEVSSDVACEIWEELAREQAQEWENDPEYADVQAGEVVEAGDDRYLVVSADRMDYNGIPYQVKKVYYIDMREAGRSVEWTLELSEIGSDEHTAPIVGELAQCYGIAPDCLTVDGVWAQEDAQRQAAQQDVYEPQEGSPALERADGYQYLGTTTVAFADGTLQSPVMVPMGSRTEVTQSRILASMHGVSVRIEWDKLPTLNYLARLEDNADADCRIAEESGAGNIRRSQTMAMEGFETAAYNIVTYEETAGTGAEKDTVAKVRCMIRLKDTYAVICDLTLRSGGYDASTDQLLQELEAAYGINLSEYYRDKKTGDDRDSKGQDTMADLLAQSGLNNRRAPSLPETIQWFNASYAALTYSNGWDWQLVGGLEPTEDNAALADMMLRSSWSVRDAESARETVDSLIAEGHREKCREYMEQLEEWGLLDAGQEKLLDKLSQLGAEENPGRYVIAYQMHQNKISPEYIAAWDLCRANQLYADYYLCGYMSYEEAMDASLENSLVLQGMYSSWEEMMDAYLVGYQFWNGDLAVTADSPSLRRYHYYEMLRDLPDGPYSLDWNLDLKKDW